MKRNYRRNPVDVEIDCPGNTQCFAKDLSVLLEGLAVGKDIDILI